jgi:hypothetical protein
MTIIGNTKYALQALGQRLAALPPVRCVSERSAKRFPLGYFVIVQRLGGFSADYTNTDLPTLKESR